MTPYDKHIRQLTLWNRFWLVSFVVTALVAGGFGVSYYLDNVVRSKIGVLKVHRTQDGDLKFHSSSDGPFIITHLSTAAMNEEEKSVAQLSSPIVIIDSAGAVLSKSHFDELKWYNYLGELRSSPAAGTEIRAFYTRPLVTQKDTQ